MHFMVEYLYHLNRKAGAVLVTPSDHDTPKARFGMYPQYTAKDVARFWSKIDRSGGPATCWNWISSTFDSGYGQFKVGERNLRSHRVAWEITRGAIPCGLFVLHHCDNRRCCNPAHLWLGTHKENMADMQQKNRAASGDNNGSRLHPERLVRGDAHPARRTVGWSQGERNGEARLCVADVIAIRARYAVGGITMQALGSEYGVDKQTIHRVVRRKGWRHV